MVRKLWVPAFLCQAFILVGSAPAQAPQPTAAGAGLKTTAKPGIDPAKTGPVRHYIMVQLRNDTDLLDLDRWYMTYHAPETLRRTQRRQTKYTTSRTFALPAEEAAAMNLWQGRMTEIGFASLADFDKGWLAVDIEEERRKITAPPKETVFRAATATIPLQPSEVFVDHPTPPKGTPYFRWIFFYNYPEGVSVADGEKWFREVFAKQLAAAPEVKRFVTFETLTRSSQWQRVAEVWFNRHSDWKKAVYDQRATFPKPPWGGEFPFLKFQSTFIGENPDVDFLTQKAVIP